MILMLRARDHFAEVGIPLPEEGEYGQLSTD